MGIIDVIRLARTKPVKRIKKALENQALSGEITGLVLRGKVKRGRFFLLMLNSCVAMKIIKAVQVIGD